MSKMDSNTLPSINISRELRNLHEEIEAHYNFIGDSLKISESNEAPASSPNVHIGRQTYDRKMEFFSDEKFFSSRSKINTCNRDREATNLSEIRSDMTTESEILEDGEMEKNKCEKKKFYGFLAKYA